MTESSAPSRSIDGLYDPEILRQERAKIFDRTWIYAAHESELKATGAFCSRTVAGRPVIV